MGQALPKASEQARLREPLAVRLFGHADLTVGGRPFALATPRKSLEVIAYLLLHRAAPVSRDYLAFTLFPDDEEATALSKLRRTLSDLQRVLPQPASSYIAIDTEKIAWNRDAAVWLDVDAFVEASRDAWDTSIAPSRSTRRRRSCSAAATTSAGRRPVSRTACCYSRSPAATRMRVTPQNGRSRSRGDSS